MPYHAYESVSATSAVKTVSVLSIPSNADKIEIQATTGPIRYTVDGATNPSQTSGMILYASDRPTAMSPDRLRLLRFCRGSGSDATLSLHYRGKDRTPTYPQEDESHSSQSSVSTSSSSLSSSSSSKSTSSSSRSSLSTSSSSWSSVSTSSSSQSAVGFSHGMLTKTPYSYLTRENADFVGLNYSTNDFSVELAVDLPAGGFSGSYGELMRHGDKQNAFYTAKSGFSIHAGTYGYAAYSGWYLSGSVMGGGQIAGCSSSPNLSGRHHITMTFKRSTGTVKIYIDGVLINSDANASVVMPSTPGGTLTIGGANKVPATYTPAVEGNAMPEFFMHYARLWNGELTGTNVADLYSRWNGTSRTDLPAGISPSIVSAWYMNEQVGSKTGSAGTGWVKDSVGGNHLKIVDTTAISGGTQSTLSAARTSGSPAITSPSNGATGVDGNVTIKANGIYGLGEYVQYYIEADTSNTFNTADLRSSGWTLSSGQWQPLLKPSTTYYIRVKAREGNNTGSESSWSSTVSFTTRAAATYYVRPKTTAGTYGSENGTSYANAWNGFRHNGSTDGLAANLLKAQCDLRNLSPGDEVYACGNFGLLTGASVSLPSTYPNREFVCGHGLSGYPVTVRMDHGAYPGAIYHVYKYTGSYSWTAEGSGVYSTSTYITTSWIAIDDGGGVPDMGADGSVMSLLLKDNTATLASPGFYYSGGKMYVKMPDGNSPANKLWYLVGQGETYGLFTLASQYVKFQGGSWFGTSPMTEISSDPSTFVHIKDALLKYATEATCIFISDYFDDWTVENCEICYVPNGIYGWNTPYGGAGLTGDRMTVANCYIHDIGDTGWEDADAHCVGWQAGNAWTIQDCLLSNSGSAVTQWGSSAKESKNNVISRNVIINIKAKSNTFGAGISFENGATTPGARTGSQVIGNIIYNADGPGIHYSAPDAVTIQGNLFVNTGTNASVDSDTRNGISLVNVSGSYPAKATINDNVVVNPGQKYVRIGGSGDLSYLSINDNRYYADAESDTTAGKFQCLGYLGGTSKTFVQWKAGLTFDQLSAWGDPESAVLPDDFDSMGVDFFLGLAIGDVNGDGVVNSTDLSVMQSDPDAPRLALERYLNLLI